jgi:hypothetical protein
MPDNLWKWIWFAFFVGGSLGGWAMLVLFIIELRAYRREMRRIGEAEGG